MLKRLNSLQVFITPNNATSDITSLSVVRDEVRER